MVTTQELFSYLHYKLKIDAEDKSNALWPSIAAAIDLQRDDPLNNFLFAAYPDMVRQEPLIFEILESVITQKICNAMRQEMAPRFGTRLSAPYLFLRWLLNGERDMSYASAELFVPVIQAFISRGNAHQYEAIRMACYSPMLWSLLEPDILKGVADPTKQTDDYFYFQILLFRYAPEKPELYPFLDKAKFYAWISRIHPIIDRSSLLGLRNVFTGLHNNALAWHTALACSPKPDRCTEDWMQMLDTFSSLNLDPKDQNSWKFWHILCDSVKDDPGRNNLFKALSEIKPYMPLAFANEWSIVDALYEGDVRYEQAARIYSTDTQDSLALP